jgi:hypothetical protein
LQASTAHAGIVGGFFGRSVQVRPNVVVSFAALSNTGPAATGLGATFTPVAGGPVPPPPATLPNDVNGWFSVVGTYAQQLLQAGYTGPTLTLPLPPFGNPANFQLPLLNTQVSRGSGGLLPIDPPPPGNAPNFPTPDPVAPTPSPNFQSWEPGLQTFGGDVFGGTFEIAAHADANQSAPLGFWTHGDMNMALTLTFFGQNISPALGGTITADTATEKLQPNGNSQPFGQAQVTASVAVAGKIFDKTYNQLGPITIDNLAQQTFPLLPPPTIPIPLPPPFTGNIIPKVKAQYGIPISLTLAPAGFSLAVTPTAGVGGSIQGGVGLGIAGFGATVGLKGSLTLAQIGVPLTGGLNWLVDRTPQNCEATLDGALTVGIKVTVLNGKISFVVTINLPIIGSFDILSVPIVSFNGFDLINQSVPLATFSHNLFPLDPTQCELGSITCANTATPNSSFVDAFDIDTGLAPLNTTIGSTYGQAACEDQYLAEVDLTQAPFLNKNLFLFGGWSAALTEADQPCAQRQAVLTVFGLSGTTWTVFDEVNFVGQIQGGTCQAVVQSRVNASQAGVDGVQIKPSSQFQHVRAAINATVNGAKAPINAFGLIE